MTQTETIAAMRRFNRFYTRRIGLLDETLTDSGYTVAEARVLFEVGHSPPALARDIAVDLLLDPAYLTRILKRLERDGLVVARPSDGDGRRRDLELTPKGEAALQDLQARADAQMAGLLEPLDAATQARVGAAMEDIQSLLERGKRDAAPVTIRPHRIGDIGYVVHRQSILYASEYGWDIGYEGLIARIAGDFITGFRPGRDFCWIAEHRGRIVGSVFLVCEDDDIARLRLLYVEPDARGLGIGAKLTATCIDQAKACGYRRLVLWTNDILHAARHIYQRAGFTLTKEERHHSFGKELVGQTWELAL